jgi:hypothetical protein
LTTSARRLGERPAASALVAQRQRTVAVAVEAHDLHVRNAHLLRVLLREQLAHPAVAASSWMLSTTIASSFV